MCEKNPLEISSAPPTTNGKRNRKGRPRKINSVTFSSPPRSLVSQMIRKMIAQNQVKLPIENLPNEDTVYNSVSLDDFDQTRSCTSPEKKLKQPEMFVCEYSECNYSTKLSSNLLKHRRIHSGEKPYLCDRCSFRTSFSNSLKVHRRLHTTERPYQCSKCDYRCNSISNLKKHCHTRHKEEMKMDMETKDMF